MAETINLKIVLEGKGVKRVTSDLGKLNKTTENVKKQQDNVSNSANKLKRNLEGTAQRANNTTKDFSRMQQGMGGLVQAYATVAANVFALSSAFLVLRNAADLSSMVKSADDFSNRFGVSVTRITRNLQQATGQALSFAQALPTVNKAVSAGLGEEEITKLAVAATKAAQTFGGTANEALARFISAAQRGRVEIVNTLGIVIQTEQAYRDYAATVGKTAQELTAFDRQQAIVNKVVEESANVFQDVKIDPNPFQRLLVTLTDLKDTILSTITDAITPLFNAFNRSKAAAAALIALIASSVGSRIFPALQEQIIAIQQRGLQSTRKARAAAAAARGKETKFLLETQRQVTGLTSSQLKQRSQLFRSHYREVLTQHKSFGKQLIDERKNINRAVLNEQRAAIARELRLRALGRTEGRQTAFAGISTRALENERNRLAVLGNELGKGVVAQKNFARATAVTDQQIQTMVAKASIGFTRLKTTIIEAGSAFRSGFAQSFSRAQTNIVGSIRIMNVAWLKFVRDVRSASLAESFINFSRAAGRSAGVLVGVLSRLLSAFTSITLAVSIGTFIWGKYGDSIRGISPAQRALIDSSEELNTSLEEVGSRLSENLVKLGDEAPQSLNRLRDALLFTAGTFGTLTTAINKFRTTVVESLGGQTVNQAVIELDKLEKKAEELRRVSDFEIFVPLRERGFTAEDLELQKVNNRISELRELLNTVADNTTPRLIKSLRQASQFAGGIGFSNIGNRFREELQKAFDLSTLQDPTIGFSIDDLVGSVETGDIDKISASISRIRQNFGEGSDEFVKFTDALFKAVTNFSGVVNTVSQTNANAIKQLTETNQRIQTFVDGIDKLRTQSAPNKEIVGFVLDINRQLKELDRNQENLSNTSLAGNFADPKELNNIKAILGFAIDSEVQISDALERGLKLQENFVAQQQVRAVGAEQIKALQIELNAIKNKEAKTDSERLDNIRDRLDLERKIVQQELRAAQVNIAAQRNVLTGSNALKLSEAQRGIEEAKLATLVAQESALKGQLFVLNQNLDVVREEAKIREETLDALKSTNSTLGQTLAINQKLSTNYSQDLAIRKAILNNEKTSLELQRQSIEKEIKRFDNNEKTAEQDRKRRLELQGQLLLIEAQTRELNRQNLALAARTLQDQGVDLTREGMVVLGQTFTRTLRDGVRDLEPTLTTLGRGFAETVNSSVDSVVDELMTSGSFSRFGRTLKEAIQAGLREAFSTAIQNRIKESISAIFPEQEVQDPQEKATRDLIGEIEAQRTILQNNTSAIRENTSAILGRSSESGSTPVSGGILQGILEINQEGNQTLNSVGDLISQGNSIQKEVKEASKEGFSALIGTVTNFISGLFNKGGDSSESGILSTILSSVIGNYFATGGVTTGMNRIQQRAEGTITNGPELAVLGEGKKREAVVPLPNNREIPVQLMGDSSGGDINITQHYDFSNAAPETEARLRQHARLIEERTFNRVFSEINKGGRYAKISGRR